MWGAELNDKLKFCRFLDKKRFPELYYNLTLSTGMKVTVTLPDLVTILTGRSEKIEETLKSKKPSQDQFKLPQRLDDFTENIRAEELKVQ